MSQYARDDPRRDPAGADPVRGEQRAAERRSVCLTGRMTWRDTDGSLRTVRVRTRDVSHVGVFLECVSGCGAIPLYRLVDLKLDRAARLRDDVPGSLKQPRVPAAVYRVGPRRKSTGLPDGFALRLLIKPDRRRKKAHKAASSAGLKAG